MSTVTGLDGQHKEARKIGEWLAKLGSYLAHERLASSWGENERKTFYAELVCDLMHERYPASTWSADALRYVRRRCEFFPRLKRLCDLLDEFAAPLRVAEAQKKMLVSLPETTGQQSGYGTQFGTLPMSDRIWLEGFREHQADGFRQLAAQRRTTPQEAHRSQVSCLKTYASYAYEQLSESDKAPLIPHDNDFPHDNNFQRKWA